MHGGDLTSLADTAVATTIRSILPEGSGFVTVELHLKFFSGENKVAEFNALIVVKRRWN